MRKKYNQEGIHGIIRNPSPNDRVSKDQSDLCVIQVNIIQEKQLHEKGLKEQTGTMTEAVCTLDEVNGVFKNKLKPEDFKKVDIGNDNLPGSSTDGLKKDINKETKDNENLGESNKKDSLPISNKGQKKKKKEKEK